MKIVPDHSAILARYANESVHANHMDMTKFGSANNKGYRDVSDTLWIWANDAAKQSLSAHPTTETIRGIREGRLGRTQNVFAGKVNSGGGPVMQGNQISEGSIVNNFGW